MSEEEAQESEAKEEKVEEVEEEEQLVGEEEVQDDLEFFYDVPLQIIGELGRLTVRIRDLLALKEGSVLELEKLAGEPLEVLINGKLICRGEVIVINEKFGIRMTDIVSPHENIDLKTKTATN